MENAPTGIWLVNISDFSITKKRLPFGSLKGPMRDHRSFCVKSKKSILLVYRNTSRFGVILVRS